MAVVVRCGSEISGPNQALSGSIFQRVFRFATARRLITLAARACSRPLRYPYLPAASSAESVAQHGVERCARQNWPIRSFGPLVSRSPCPCLWSCAVTHGTGSARTRAAHTQKRASKTAITPYGHLGLYIYSYMYLLPAEVLAADML